MIATTTTGLASEGTAHWRISGFRLDDTFYIKRTLKWPEIQSTFTPECWKTKDFDTLPAPRIPLPNGWSRRVRSAVIHATSGISRGSATD